MQTLFVKVPLSWCTIIWHEVLIRNTGQTPSIASRKKYFCLRLLQPKNLAQIRLHLALSILCLAVSSPDFLVLITLLQQASLKSGLSNQMNAKISSRFKCDWLNLICNHNYLFCAKFRIVKDFPFQHGCTRFTMAIWVVEFSSGGYKIRKIFA